MSIQKMCQEQKSFTITPINNIKIQKDDDDCDKVGFRSMKSFFKKTRGLPNKRHVEIEFIEKPETVHEN